MKIKNAKKWAPSGAWTYAVAGALFAAAFILRYLMHDTFDSHLPFTFFFVATIVTEFAVGFGPALFVLALSLPTAAYFFIPPFAQFDGPTATDAYILGAIFIVTVLVIALIEQLRRSQYQAQLMAEVARGRYEMLLQTDGARQNAENEAADGARMMNSVVAMFPNIWYITRPQGGAEYIDPRLWQLTGLEQEPGTQPRFYDMVHPDDADAIKSMLMHITKMPDRQAKTAFRIRLANGAYRQCHGVFLFSEDNYGGLIRLEDLGFDNSDTAEHKVSTTTTYL